MGALFDAIAHDAVPEISGRDNLNTMRLVEAAYLSAVTGRTVSLKEIAD